MNAVYILNSVHYLNSKDFLKLKINSFGKDSIPEFDLKINIKEISYNLNGKDSIPKRMLNTFNVKCSISLLFCKFFLKYTNKLIDKDTET